MPDLRAYCPLPAAPARRWGRARLSIAAATLMLAGAAMAGDSGQLARTPPAADSGRTSVSTVVAGIVSFTRWPAETTAIRLCTLGHGRGVDDLLEDADLGSAQRRVSVHVAASVANAGNECDVIYVGALASNIMREVLQGALGRPMLTIGEGPEFCSDGGMFCLLAGAAEARFSVNLDAVARSGLRVNPWVLRIARNTRAIGQ